MTPLGVLAVFVLFVSALFVIVKMAPTIMEDLNRRKIERARRRAAKFYSDYRSPSTELLHNGE